MTKEEIIQRRKDIYNMRESGMTYKEIAEVYGVTRERVRQLYEKQKRIYINDNKWGYWK